MKNVKQHTKILILLGIITIIFIWWRDDSGPIEFTDRNSNEIWDDLEPFIQKVAKTENQRRALEFDMKSMQRTLTNPEVATKERSGQVYVEIFRSASCARKVWGKNSEVPIRLKAQS